MVNHSPSPLDAVFAALADPTRRAIVARLAAGGAATSELARPFAMSLPGFMKHVGILERAALLRRRKVGRVVQCRLAPRGLKEAFDWLDRYRRFWEERLDALERYLAQEENLAWPKQTLRRNRRSRSSAASKSPPRRSTGRGPTRKR